MIMDPLAIFVIMTATIAFSYILESRYRWAKRIGAVMTLIILGLLLSNINIVPHESPTYEVTFVYLIPISISLLLLRIRMEDIKRIDRTFIWLFLAGIAGTTLGAVTTFFLFGHLIGAESWKLAGQLTASYIGGGENAVAVGTALNVSKELFTAAFAADNVVTAIWMMIGLTAPVGLMRIFSREIPDDKIEMAKAQAKPFTSVEFLPSLFYSLTAAALILLLSRFIAQWIHELGYADWNTTILWVTTLSLIVANTRLHRHFKVSYLLGMVIFNYFFFSLGAISSISDIIRLGPPVFVFVCTVVAIHGLVIFTVGKLLKANIGQLMVTSQACIGGPSTAVALAEANEWPHLVVPGIIIGVTGYAIANYLGFLVAFILRSF